MKRPLPAAVILVALSLVGCASGPKYTDVAEKLPALPADEGRIFFYRDGSPVGATVKSPILLDGVEVGQSIPGSFFFIDRPPGDYRVTCSTETAKSLTFNLPPNGRRYVRTRVSLGVFVEHIGPQLEDEEEAMKTLNGASYIGAPLSSTEPSNDEP